MEISSFGNLPAHSRSAAGVYRTCGRAAAILASCLALIPPADAGIGDLDVRFGTNGEVAVEGNRGPAVMELPDGRLMVIGYPDPASPAERGMVAINRYSALGKPDVSFGSAGRMLVALPLPDVGIRAAALQPDGKLIVVGWGAKAAGEGVRLVARITDQGVVDAGFGVNGIATGGPGGWGGYSRVVVLPSGEILAAINELDGDNQIDRFSANGTPTPGTSRQTAAISGMATLADGRVVVIGHENNRGVAWRLLADGRLDTSFGSGGYAALSAVFPSRLALDPMGQQIAVCSDLGVEKLTADGSADTSFGSKDGLVPFDGKTLPKVGRCEGLLVNTDGSVVLGASDVQGTESVLYHGYVIGLRPNGSPDLRFNGKGYVGVRTRSAPGTRWEGVELLRTRDRNALFVWNTFTDEGSQTIIDWVDLGEGASAGAVGVPLRSVRVMENAGSYFLNVVRSGSPKGAASVRVETVPGSAASGDFTETAKQLVWSDGASGSQDVELPIADDGEFEGEESFQVRFFDAQGVAIATEALTVTIVDDDALRALRFVDKAITVKKSAVATTSLRLSRDDQGAGPLTVYYYAENGIDACCTGRVSWAAGERGVKKIPLGYVDALGSGYSLDLVDEQWMQLGVFATVTIDAGVAPPAPAPTPTPAPSPVAGGGSSSGGGGSMALLDLAVFVLGLGAVAGRRRRRAELQPFVGIQ